MVGVTNGDFSDPLSGLKDIQGDAFLAKYDGAGNFQWTKQLGMLGVNEVFLGVSTDGLGNIYTSGTTNGSLGGPSAGEKDALVAKYDAAGGLQWTRQLGTRFTDRGRSISADNLGNVYVAYDHDTDTSRSVASIAKYDAAGNLQWNKQFPGTNNATAASADGLGNVYISVAGNDNDATLAMYDTSGNLQWSTQIGGGSYVAADGLGSVYLAGATSVVSGGRMHFLRR